MTEKVVEEKGIERDKYMVLDFSKFAQLIVADLKKNKQSSSALKKYSRSEVTKFIENPSSYEKQLREISTILYNKSPHYKRLIMYFAKMPLFSYVVEPVNIDFEKYNLKALTNQYKKTIQFLDTMNMAHEFGKIMQSIFKEDIFYGYEHSTKNSYFIQKLDPNYCKISSIEDGCYNFAFDFSFFKSNMEKLDTYPPEFKRKFNKYSKSPELKWQELDSKFTICIKANEEIEYVIPPFAAVFSSIFDIEDYRNLRKDKEELSNYKVLIQKLPIREKSEQNNDFMIDYDNMIMFHNKASEALPEQVGIITTPMDVSEISFEKDGADRDNVDKATRDYWTGTGVSQLLFNTDKSSSIGLTNSIKTDEMIIFALLRQFERWLNRRLKFNAGNSNFRVNLLNITEFNKKEVFDSAIEAASYGFPTKTMAAAALGMSPSSLLNMTILENDILKLNEKMIPLTSSHTQSGKDGSKNQDTGRDEKEVEDLSDEGLKARDEEKGE
ncbi:hypothetical protein M5X17_27405 [Paenibacillus alvei]|uniref:hypothetical protein n=1 Tax=Paenibacillus alvei TaxID=44250 RepID=UPI0022813CBA|nr:hypothetical protein [Paenibacillus alvei]MCY9737432.1 hypothetical protein [Paenibacillus alvei]